ncbi:MAG TPA: 2OG-Fe(II) oxygenase [Gemmatimonadaceae bacterium]|nr:2OG-Fe(II) oxygenase [Gemmatimonadaceae bacterium]
MALSPGDPAPWFRARVGDNPVFAFDAAAGRYVVLCFFLSAHDAVAQRALASVAAHRAMFDDSRCSLFGVSIDPGDEREARVRDAPPGIRVIRDLDGAVARAYGAIPADARPDEGPLATRRLWVVLDPTLRVMAVFPFAADGGEQASLFAYLQGLPPVDRFAGFTLQAPALMIPNVFEAEFCRLLIGLYDKNSGRDSGFMRDVDGKTSLVIDARQKRRKDHLIDDPAVLAGIVARLKRRLLPEVAKALQFKATRMERYMVSCYAAEDGGHFRPHRDNTARGTEHRKFAVSLNLNDDFDGGELVFPEYGERGFKMAPGMAGVFSCALLHKVTPVTRGRRFAFLPFLYDDDGARTRLANNKFLADDLPPYRDPLIR